MKTSERAKRLRLTITSVGELVATKPAKMPDRVVEGFVLQKANWIFKKLAYFESHKVITLESKGKSYKEYKLKVQEFIEQRVEFLNKGYGFAFKSIRVKNQKTRWGSCSKKGNLNFNYKILFFPKELADYIILHELCHLEELNHSKKFWALVKQQMPNYLQIRKALKKVGQI
ncbi:M48 family metallopeptidase [Candidatus Parcubacteria bacterium]|nr:M48 family metallopeptidase [Candidatus Parcubacteria bacterium]